MSFPSVGLAAVAVMLGAVMASCGSNATNEGEQADDAFCSKLEEWRDAAQHTELVANTASRRDATGRSEMNAAFQAATSVVVPTGRTAAQGELSEDALEWARRYEVWLLGLPNLYAAANKADWERLLAASNEHVLAINDLERAMGPRLEAECGIPPIDPYQKPPAAAESAPTGASPSN